MRKKIIGALTLAAVLCGCASPTMLPQTDNEVDYFASGFVKGSGWHDGAIYDATEEEIAAAIQSALQANGLRIHEHSREQRKFVAESPMNMYRWTTYVAVYYRRVSDKRMEIHVVSIGTKDINVLTGDSELPLPPKIVASVSTSLSRRNR